MKNPLQALLLLALITIATQTRAALPDGATAPNWTLTDINGNTHTLYDYLDQGKMVALDFFATWCGPCWNYHNTNALKDLYNNFGPPGTDEVMVFGIEGDVSTNTNCLYGPAGCVGGTIGNWVAGTPYPIIDLTSSTVTGQYAITYYPTIYAICPDRTIFEAGQIPYSTWQTWIQTCQLDATGTATDVVCAGEDNGTVDLMPTGGWGNLNFSWSNGANTEDLDNLAAGNYFVTITEGHGYSIERGPYTVGGPTQPLDIITNYEYDVDCFGADNGQIDISAAGGTPGYSYLWSNGQTSTTLFNLSPGIYQVTVTDNNSCTDINAYSISEPPELTFSIFASDENCDNTDGEIIAQAQGGSPGYLYDIGFGPQSNGYFPNLSGDAYFLTITDANGCQQFDNILIANIPAPYADAGPNELIDCNNNTTTLDGTNSDAGPDIIYIWTTTDGNIVSGADTPTPLVDATGTYELAIINTINGCQSIAYTTVSGNTTTPNADAGPNGDLTCTTTSVTLDGSGSDNGANITYLWTTSDGNIVSGDTTTAPLVDASGTYELLVTNTDNGCTALSTTSVGIDDTAPTSDAGPTAAVDCNNTQTTLDGTNSSNGPDYTYQWTTTDGNIVSGETSLSPTVDQGGSYQLLVTNTINGCTATSSTSVAQNDTPPAASVGSPATLTCQTTTLTLDGSGSESGSDITYQWTTADGNIVSGDNTTTPTVDQPGTYLLLVTNTSTGCTASSDVAIAEDLADPTADAGTANPLTCTTSTISLDGSNSSGGSDITYLWTTSDGNIVSGDDTTNPVIDEQGTYSLLVTDTSNGCTATSSVSVSENTTAPVADAGPDDELNCSDTDLALDGSGSSSGPNISYQWTTADGNIISGADSATPLVDQAGTYSLLVTNTDNGCTASANSIVTQDVSLPTADAGPDGELNCNVNQLTLIGDDSSDGDNITYLWTTSDGNIVSGDDSTTPLVDQAGTYSLQVTNTDTGCSATSSVEVSENTATPTSDAGPTDELNCDNNSLTLDGSGSSSGSEFTYLWTTTNGNIVSGDDTTEPVIDQAGDYDLLVTNTDNGCSSTSSVSISEDTNSPTADAGPDDELNCSEPDLTLDGSGSSSGSNISYLWTTTNGNIVSGADSATPLIDQAGTYSLLVTNTDNGCTASANAIVTQDVNLPTADAGPDGELNCNVNQLTLNGDDSSDGDNITYQWTTSDGNIVSGDDSTTPLVDQAGTYSLQVINTDTGCSATSSVEVSENTTTPTSDAGPTDELNCDNNSLTLDGSGSSSGSEFTYLWTTTNGNIVSGDDTTEPVIDQSGDYELLVTNTDNGCTSTSSVSISEDTNSPTADAGPDDELNCSEPDLTLDGSGSSSGSNISYLWTTTNGNIVSGADSATPLIDQTGTYSLLVTNTDNGCTASANAIVTQDVNLPTADAGPDGELNCNVNQLTLNGENSSSGNDITYLWTTSDGNIVSGDDSTTPLVDQPGTYSLQVTNTATGCSATSTVVISQSNDSPTADAGTAEEINCTNNSLTLDGSGSSAGSEYSYLWTTVDGNIVSGGNTIAPLVDQPGAYTLQVTNMATGCLSAATVQIVENIAAPAADAGSTAQFTCHDNTLTLNGSSSSSGTGITYLWTTANGNIASGATTTTPEISAPGDYTLLVTNTDNGCTASANVTITATQTLELNLATATDATCFGESNGSATVEAAGGNQPYQFTWPGGTEGATQNDLAAGNYLVSVTDGDDCTATIQVAIAQPAPIDLSLTASSEVNCYDGNDGMATVDAQGGTGDFTYTWPNGDTGQSMSNLSAGEYTVTATDANLCSEVLNLTITQPNELVNDITHTDETASGLDDGTATSNPSGGIGPYSFLWSNGETTASISGLPPGTYTVTTTDAKGCSHVGTVAINAVDCALQVESGSTDVSCFGGNNGQAFITNITGSEGPFTYNWSTGATTSSIDNLTVGTYIISISDGEGCLFVEELIVAEPPALTTDFIYDDPNCFGATDGFVSVVPDGGTQPFTYLWQDGSTGETLQDVGAGTYTVVVTDHNGCSVNTAITLTEPNAITANIVDQTNVQCANDAIGSATAQGSGGTGILSWLWSDGQTGETATSLVAGTYTVTATDQEGCTAESMVTITASDDVPPTALGQDVVVLLDENGAASLAAATVDAGSFDNCALTGLSLDVNVFDCSHLGDNSVELTAIDGAGNNHSTSVTVTVHDNVAPTITCDNDVIVGSCSEPVIYDIPNATDNCTPGSPELLVGLGSGNVFPIGVNIEVYRVSDESGNSSTCSFTVTVEDSEAPTIVCPENITVSGCAETINYDLPDAFDDCSSIGNPVLIQGLGSGAVFPEGVHTEIYEVADGFGNTTQCSFTISIVNDMEGDILEVENACFGEADGSATVSGTGGSPPYTYAWDNGQTGPTATDLAADFYSVTVTDSEGCTNQMFVTVSENPSISAMLDDLQHENGNNADGAISIIAEGGTPPYNYNWTADNGFSSTDEDISALSTGTYECLITDANGCVFTAGPFEVESITGTNDPAWARLITLYPNPSNGRVVVQLPEIWEEAQMTVYNATGQLLKPSLVIQTTTPGQYRLDLNGHPNGVYLLKIRVEGEILVKRIVLTRSN